jgi:hypothetical protein
MNVEPNSPARPERQANTALVRRRVKEQTDKLDKERKRKLRQQLAKKNKQKEKDPVTPTKQRHKLTDEGAVDLASDTGDELRHKVGHMAQDLYYQFSQIGDRQGANRDAWVRTRNADEDDPVAVRMNEIDQAIKKANAVLMGASEYNANLPQLAQSLAAIRDVTRPRIETLLREVEGIIRTDLADGGGGTEIADPMQVLNGLESTCDADAWQAAVKEADARQDTVWGSPEAIATLTRLMLRYYRKWNALGTDGLKGAKFGPLRELAEVRMTIVNTVADSKSPQLMACCRPGTQFYEKIMKLASQACSDRDVQNLTEWWKSAST